MSKNKQVVVFVVDGVLFHSVRSISDIIEIGGWRIDIRLKIRIVKSVKVKIKRIAEDVPMPEYKTSGAVAFDVSVSEGGTLEPGERKKFPTGLVVCVPEGHALILAPRSSNAKKGIVLANNVGIIDQDYCGPDDQLHAYLYNLGKEIYTVEKGERVMQGIIVPVVRADFEETVKLEAPNRGGFGTTG